MVNGEPGHLDFFRFGTLGHYFMAQAEGAEATVLERHGHLRRASGMEYGRKLPRYPVRNIQRKKTRLLRAGQVGKRARDAE